MGFEEIIGFIITILAMGFLVVKRILDERNRRQHPEEYALKQDEQEKRLREFMRSLDEDMEQDEKQDNDEEEEEEEETFIPPPKQIKTPPPPLPVSSRRRVDDKFRYQTNIETFKQKSQVESREFKTNIESRYTKHPGADVVSEDMRLQESQAYEIVHKKQTSRARNLLNQLSSKKDMVILYEIFNRKTR